MKQQSNIFVYIELGKLVSNLNLDILLSKEHLKSQASYFEIIPARYFSAGLNDEWLNITQALNIPAPDLDKKGKITVHAAMNSIDLMTSLECHKLSLQIINLFEKVKLEFS